MPKEASPNYEQVEEVDAGIAASVVGSFSKDPEKPGTHRAFAKGRVAVQRQEKRTRHNPGGKDFVLTGALSKYTRDEAEA